MAGKRDASGPMSVNEAGPLIVGRMIHYVLRNGECRPGIVVSVKPKPNPEWKLNAIVLRDGSNDDGALCRQPGAPRGYNLAAGEYPSDQPVGFPLGFWAVEAPYSCEGLEELVRVPVEEGAALARTWHWPRDHEPKGEK